MSNQDLKTKAGYLAFHSECCDKMKEITKRKNSDYTGNSTDPFANFQSVSKIGICSTEQGFMVRMMDKLMRIRALTVDEQTAQVKDEAIEDTLLDLANYSILLAGFLRAKNKITKSPYKVGDTVRFDGMIGEIAKLDDWVGREISVDFYGTGFMYFSLKGVCDVSENKTPLEVINESTNNT